MITPGPWSVVASYSENGRRSFQVFGGPDQRTQIADIGYWNPQAEADARLIANSRHLLRSAERLLKAVAENQPVESLEFRLSLTDLLYSVQRVKGVQPCD